ncbi:Aste57867_16129 [Aphanomyces stellatus]|uniref:Aste57867_16129 protein n=1 Tax=Aphanomyces stellatus TaxID=120398 RepID=A0A485L5Q3_9STRA|nr:hypothetical protein As57867_016073 [Aphanomyces stellatus]VFT92911.1 Aste57867_16129 [Aphanomyces stellatus]
MHVSKHWMLCWAGLVAAQWDSGAPLTPSTRLAFYMKLALGNESEKPLPNGLTRLNFQDALRDADAESTVTSISDSVTAFVAKLNADDSDFDF